MPAWHCTRRGGFLGGPGSLDSAAPTQCFVLRTTLTIGEIKGPKVCLPWSPDGFVYDFILYHSLIFIICSSSSTTVIIIILILITKEGQVGRSICLQLPESPSSTQAASNGEKLTQRAWAGISTNCFSPCSDKMPGKATQEGVLASSMST